MTSEQIERARKLIDAGESRRYIAGLLNVGRVTVYRALLASPLVISCFIRQFGGWARPRLLL